MYFWEKIFEQAENQLAVMRMMVRASVSEMMYVCMILLKNSKEGSVSEMLEGEVEDGGKKEVG